MLIKNSFLALAAVVPAATAAAKTTNALALAAGVDGDGAGPPQATTVVAGWRGRPNPQAARGSAPSPHKKADLGALEAVQRQLQPSPPCPTSCLENQVGYCAGSPISAINGGLVCNGECCTGDGACQGFTGCVKKDNSCEGQKACLDAFAPSGIENSCKGAFACQKMAFAGGSVGALKGSCIGEKACDSTGAASGEIGGIYESCHGVKACYRLGFSGDVVSVQGSCNGHEACWFTATSGGEVGVMEKSCNGESSCKKVAELGGKVEAMDKSCHGLNACNKLASTGAAGPITKSCIRDNSCYGIGSFLGSVQSITQTCNNDVHTPCSKVFENVAYTHIGHLTKFIHAEVGKKYTREEIGSIVECNGQCVNDSECMGIKWKDHSGMPCRFFGGEISENKCNGRNVCITV